MRTRRTASPTRIDCARIAPTRTDTSPAPGGFPGRRPRSAPPGLRLSRTSFGAGTESSGQVAVDEVPDCADRRVLVVDDILDTGRTLQAVSAALAAAGAAEVRTCVLLDKPARRAVEVNSDRAPDISRFTRVATLPMVQKLKVLGMTMNISNSFLQRN